MTELSEHFSTDAEDLSFTAYIQHCGEEFAQILFDEFEHDRETELCVSDEITLLSEFLESGNAEKTDDPILIRSSLEAALAMRIELVSRDVALTWLTSFSERCDQGLATQIHRVLRKIQRQLDREAQ